MPGGALGGWVGGWVGGSISQYEACVSFSLLSLPNHPPTLRCTVLPSLSTLAIKLSPSSSTHPPTHPPISR